MSANLFEKALTLGLIGGSALFIAHRYFKGPKIDKSQAFKIRQQLLKQHNVKMLYSTISFFYLVGFQSESIDCFIQLKKILEIQKPDLIVVPLSRQDFDKKYIKAMNHPKFRQSMDKFIQSLKSQDVQAIKNIQQFQLKNLQNLYLIDHCMRLKKCKVVYARRSNSEYKTLQKVYKELKQQKKQSFSTKDIKVQDYVENTVQQMSSKVALSLLPETPYKNILGIIEPQLLTRVSERWKQKLNKNFNHQVLQDLEIIKRQQESKK